MRKRADSVELPFWTGTGKGGGTAFHSGGSRGGKPSASPEVAAGGQQWWFPSALGGTGEGQFSEVIWGILPAGLTLTLVLQLSPQIL